ncbi:hypothetical protein SAMN02983003_0285 [Devosia enhydra]|uniref:Uncharacterized protein n=1 Tax=Devosia enhydra TaxID=665118 RepID=A0A1K2HT53_9HYPH|nr:hypothetical protein [Devosia enhydra]SFZ81052.1 hypothetical protein SAMN02983003_0285 [Devosia enhydra]
MIASALALCLSVGLGWLWAWHLLRARRDGVLPMRGGAFEKARQPRSFRFWFGYQALWLVGLGAVGIYALTRLVTMAVASLSAD